MEQVKTSNGTKPHGNTQTAPAQMPTGIYSAADTLTAQRRREEAASSPVAATVPEQTPPVSKSDIDLSARLAGSEVPKTLSGLPRSRSLAMQWRYVRVLVFAGWLFARVLFWQVYVRRYFRGYIDRTNTARFAKYAREFRAFAIELGGVFIKLGQFVSTRVDALPEEVVRELESLQDEVPTIPFKQIWQTLENDLGDISKHFQWVNETPIAAASLGQVHKAHLLNGEKVVVKVQRPRIRRTCYTDLAALKVVAWVAMRFRFISRRADAIALTEEFGRVLLEELSYLHEARNALIFADFFRNDLGVYIPAIYVEHTTDRVLTLEDVSSIKISDYAAMEAAGISRKDVAVRLMDTYLKQVFELFFFHADPHPGNLFVYPLPVDDPSQYANKGGRPFYLIFVDFGMTGALTRQIADGMVNTLQAVIARDPRRLVKSYSELGLLLPGADVERIIEATEATFNEVWGLSMTEIRDLDFDRAANLASEFNDLIKSMPFYIPQDFIYLGRTMGILSGMATSLDPTFNPWQELEPYAQRLAAQGFGLDVSLSADGTLGAGEIITSLLNGNGGQALQLLQNEVLRRFNPLAPTNDAMTQLRQGNIHVVSEPSREYRAQLARLETQNQRLTRAVIFGTVLIASTTLYTSGETTLATIGYAFCGLSVIYGFFKRS
jgi:predicted unusual protein kinase regulating ubiquinone biosynthesis (AarF/ABC1/UbiB family)